MSQKPTNSHISEIIIHDECLYQIWYATDLTVQIVTLE